MSGPAYKGSLGPEAQPGTRVWVRGQGWESTFYFEGKLDQLNGQIAAMQLYADRIQIDEGYDYSRISARTPTFAQGGEPEQTVRWGLAYNTEEVPLMATDQGVAMDAATKAANDNAISASQVVARQVAFARDNPKAKFSHDVTEIPTEWRSYALFVIAETLGNNDKAARFPYILSRSILVSQTATNLSPTQPTKPVVYSSTTALLQAQGPVPTAYATTLPNGQWLEHPVNIQDVTRGRVEVSQQWQWATAWDTFLRYPQT